MDEMNITSDWTKLVITKIVKKIVKDKIGANPEINLGDVYVRIGDANIEVSFAANVKVGKSEVYELLKKKLF